MTAKAKLKLSPHQIRTVVAQLPKVERLRLVQDLERATWPDRFGRLVQRIRRYAKRYPPLSEQDVVSICREVRQDLYGLTHRRRSP